MSEKHEPFKGTLYYERQRERRTDFWINMSLLAAFIAYLAWWTCR